MVGEVRKLREGARGAVFGVRAAVTCGCGGRYQATLTVGVARHALWCPWCKRRSVVQTAWRIDGPLREGARVSWQFR